MDSECETFLSGCIAKSEGAGCIAYKDRLCTA